jgi:hypothetical protein
MIRSTCGFKAAGLVLIALCCLAGAAQAPGTWQNVTPHLLDSAFRAGGSWGGMQTVIVDPVKPGDLWAGADCQGIWKSTDYGVTWAKINTGTHAAEVSGGREWCMAIDPRHSRDAAVAPTIYTGLGWGTGDLWKSTDGGVNWTDVWHNNLFKIDGTTNISSDVGGDCGGFQIVDTTGPDHLIEFMHSYWGTGGNNGLFETTDGGGKWVVHAAQTFNFQPHSDCAFALDAKTWFVVHGTTWPNNEIYRTTDGGSTWSIIANNIDLGNTPLHLGSTWYLTGSPLRKTTDNGATWMSISSAGNVGTMCMTATNHMYVSSGNRTTGGGRGNWTFRHSTIGNETAWTNDPKPDTANVFQGGGAGNSDVLVMAATFDGTNAIIVTTNWNAGIWRYVEPASGSGIVAHGSAHQSQRPVVSARAAISFSSRRVTSPVTGYGLRGEKIGSRQVYGRGIIITQK